jgi:hypothetical protein
MKNIIYDEWLPYSDYEKKECDIELHSGKIIKHVYPNAGEFNYMCGKIRLIIPESEVKNIMYRRYYMENLCSGNCNKK